MPSARCLTAVASFPRVEQALRPGARTAPCHACHLRARCPCAARRAGCCSPLARPVGAPFATCLGPWPHPHPHPHLNPLPHPLHEDDADLVAWAKDPTPFLDLPPPDMELTGWRDPFVVERPSPENGGEWVVLIGSGLKGQGGERPRGAGGLGRGCGARRGAAQGRRAARPSGASRGAALCCLGRGHLVIDRAADNAGDSLPLQARAWCTAPRTCARPLRGGMTASCAAATARRALSGSVRSLQSSTPCRPAPAARRRARWGLVAARAAAVCCQRKAWAANSAAAAGTAAAVGAAAAAAAARQWLAGSRQGCRASCSRSRCRRRWHQTTSSSSQTTTIISSSSPSPAAGTATRRRALRRLSAATWSSSGSSSSGGGGGGTFTPYPLTPVPTRRCTGWGSILAAGSTWTGLWGRSGSTWGTFCTRPT